MDAPSTDETWVDPTWTQLEGQVRRYKGRAAEAQHLYRRLKVVVVCSPPWSRFCPAFRTIWRPSAVGLVCSRRC